MSVEQGRARWRWLAVVAAALSIVIIAAIVVRATVLRDHARAVPVDVARDRYRSDTTEGTASATTVHLGAVAASDTSTPARALATDSVPLTTAGSNVLPVPALVASGVYRYRTTGEESIDALGGVTHHYPEETTITVTPDGCGVLLRWDALVERRDEWRLCATASGVVLQAIGLQYHEFYGQPDSEDVACDRTIVVVPPHAMPTPVSPVQQSCTLADDPWLPTWVVLERSERNVGGEPVEVGHVRMTIEDDDEYWEHTVVDWFLADDGLPVEVAAVKQSRSPSPVGGVVYHEEYRLELVSMTPLS